MDIITLTYTNEITMSAPRYILDKNGKRIGVRLSCKKYRDLSAEVAELRIANVLLMAERQLRSGDEPPRRLVTFTPELSEIAQFN